MSVIFKFSPIHPFSSAYRVTGAACLSGDTQTSLTLDTSPSSSLSQGDWGVWSPDSWNTPSSPPFWIEAPPSHSTSPESLSPTATRCCRDVSAKTAPQHPETWGTQAGSHPPRYFATEELPNYLSDFGLGDEWINLWVPSLCFLYRRLVSGIEETLEVFLPLPDDIPSWDQQLPTSTVNSVGGG